MKVEKQTPLAKLKIVIIYGKEEDFRLVKIIARKIRLAVKETKTILKIEHFKCSHSRDRDIFIQTIPITKQNKYMGHAYSKLLNLYFNMVDCKCSSSLFKDKISVDTIVLKK